MVAPTYLLFELIGPVVELFGYGWFAASILFGFVNWTFALLFILVAFVWGALLSVQSLLLDNWSFEMFRGGDEGSGLVSAAILENFGYRQTTLLFRLRGLIEFVRGEQSWGEMKREGFEKTDEAKAAGDDEDERTRRASPVPSEAVLASGGRRETRGEADVSSSDGCSSESDDPEPEPVRADAPPNAEDD